MRGVERDIGPGMNITVKVQPGQRWPTLHRGRGPECPVVALVRPTEPPSQSDKRFCHRFIHSKVDDRLEFNCFRLGSLILTRAERAVRIELVSRSVLANGTSAPAIAPHP